MKYVALLLLLLLVPVAFGDFSSGSTTCPSSGAKQVGGNVNAYSVTVTAALTNANFVYIGTSGVTTSNGTPLTPGSSYSASKPSPGVNPASLYFACTTSTDSVLWIASR